MEALDPDTHASFTRAINRARREDRDVAEYLHSYGLIATPQWRDQIRANTARDIADHISRLSLSEITDTYLAGAWTADSIIRGIIRRLADVEAEARKGHWIT